MKTVWVEGKNPIYARYTMPCAICGEDMYTSIATKKYHAACKRKLNAAYAAERRAR